MRAPRTIASCAAAAAVLVLAAPAQAVILDSGLDEWEETFGPSDCGDFTVTTSEVGRVDYRFEERRPGDYFWSGHGLVENVYTNDATGRSWSSRVRFFEHDTRVLSRQGTAFEMLVTQSFRADVFDEGGAVDSSNRGMVQWVLTIDTKGTPTDFDDDLVDYARHVRDHGSFRIGDFCADAVRFTTG